MPRRRRSGGAGRTNSGVGRRSNAELRRRGAEWRRSDAGWRRSDAGGKRWLRRKLRGRRMSCAVLGRRWQDAAAVEVPLAGPHRRHRSGVRGAIVASVPLFLRRLQSRRGGSSRRLGRWTRRLRRRRRRCRKRKWMRRWRRHTRRVRVANGRRGAKVSKGCGSAATTMQRLLRRLQRHGLRGRLGRSPAAVMAVVVVAVMVGAAVRRRAGGVRSMPPCPSVRPSARPLLR